MSIESIIPLIRSLAKIPSPESTGFANVILARLPFVILSFGVSVCMIIAVISRPDTAAEFLSSVAEIFKHFVSK